MLGRGSVGRPKTLEAKILFTAISIYVVGSKLQAYATRPKGGMGMAATSST